ncbi:hypothetical protein IV77_GL000270 [Olsenella uli DSM 7084]|nr:hypothetical protein IV77_GL000270 [Olsenella uli DSM 7084]
MARGGAFEAQAPGMRRSCRSSSATLKHHMSRWPRYGRHGIRGLEHQKDSRRGERLPLWGKTPAVSGTKDSSAHVFSTSRGGRDNLASRGGRRT